MSKDALYESKLTYTLNTIPPFYEPEKVSIDFQNKFYSLSVFEEWKQNNSNTSIVFEDFSATEMVDGFLLAKDKNKLLATFETKMKNYSYLLVKSNQLPIMDGFFKYVNHINVMLKDEYIARAKEELNIIESRFMDLGRDTDILNTVLSIDRYIVSADKGALVLNIQRPTKPKKVLSSFLVIAISVFLGGMVGVLFILVRNAITKRKEQLAKA